jgi:hypothetical protein
VNYIAVIPVLRQVASTLGGSVRENVGVNGAVCLSEMHCWHLVVVCGAVYADVYACSWGWPLLVSATDLINVRGLTRQIIEVMRDVVA